MERNERQMRCRSAEFTTREDGDALAIEGYFAVFDSNYEIAPGMSESIAPGAFSRSISGDIRALINHDTTLVLGRTSAHTLELRVADALRETGLRFRRALVVGTGGAARAAAYAGRQLGCEVTVAGRSVEKASALGYEAVSLEEAGSLAPDVILYTLPGSAPVPAGLPFKDAVVVEAEYRIPRLTDVPCRLYVSGRRWMLGQAVAGYRIFTGAEPNLEKMLEVL